MHRETRFTSFLLLPGMVLILAACTTSQEASYEARIRWTSYGIPHIEAADLGSLGFRRRLCTGPPSLHFRGVKRLPALYAQE